MVGRFFFLFGAFAGFCFSFCFYIIFMLNLRGALVELMFAFDLRGIYSILMLCFVLFLFRF